VSAVAPLPVRGRATWSRGPSPWRGVRASLERARWQPLAVSMGVVSLGLLFVLLAKTASMGPVAAGLKSGQILNLATVRSADELEPVLAPLFASEPERRFVAQAVFDRALRSTRSRPAPSRVRCAIARARCATRPPRPTAVKRTSPARPRRRG
jgi:hypothetical protein